MYRPDEDGPACNAVRTSKPRLKTAQRSCGSVATEVFLIADETSENCLSRDKGDEGPGEIWWDIDGDLEREERGGEEMKRDEDLSELGNDRMDESSLSVPKLNSEL